MDKFALLVAVRNKGIDDIDVIGPFSSSEKAIDYGMNIDEKVLFKKMKQPETETVLSIGEVSDLLQALSKKAAELYEDDPVIDEFMSLEDALMYIAGSISDPMVREYMLAIIKAGV